MIGMKKWIFIFAMIFISSQVSAQTLHALLFINERESGREIDRKADMENMTKYFKKIADCIGYDFRLSKNSDMKFTAEQVNREINSLNIGKNDIVIFYYSGHGYNQGKNRWPTLNLNDKNYWLSDILNVLNPKTENAKLVLCVADCCNKGYNNASMPAETFNPISNDNMRELFTGFTGKRTIIMSASKQGEYSWSDLRRGAFFGICLRSAIDSHTDNSVSSPTWTKVMSKAISLTEWMSGYKQTPQYEIINSADPFDD